VAQPVYKPSPALDTMAPPTGALEPIEPTILDESATLVGGMSYARTIARRRRLRTYALGAGLAAIGVILVVALWSLVTSGGRPRRPAAPPPAPTSQMIPTPTGRSSGITVEPIPVPPAGGSADQISDGIAKEIEMTPDEPAAGSAGKPADAQPGHRPPHDAAHRPPHKDPRPPPPPVASPALTREQLGQKFQQVSREYEGYKAKFGSRLEKEWGELATFITYMPASEDDAGRREAARRLDEFRTRMRE
ncbi:MAG TPA: hypothetical protein VF469_18325, partial [Kofleriaceae bacterium]